MGVEGKRRMIRIAGAPAAPGLAQGRLHRPDARRRVERRPGTPADERALLAGAIASARVELDFQQIMGYVCGRPRGPAQVTVKGRVDTPCLAA